MCAQLYACPLKDVKSPAFGTLLSGTEPLNGNFVSSVLRIVIFKQELLLKQGMRAAATVRSGRARSRN